MANKTNNKLVFWVVARPLLCSC